MFVSHLLILTDSSFKSYDPLIISFQHTITILMVLFHQVYEKVLEMTRTATLVKNQFQYSRQNIPTSGIIGMFEKTILMSTVAEIRTRILDSAIDLDINRDVISVSVFDKVIHTRIDYLLKGAWFSLSREKKNMRFYQVNADKTVIHYGDFAINASINTDIVPDELPFTGIFV
jgi:hypothetical protein